MSAKKYISGLLAVILVILLLIGSAGITVITHQCDTCGDLSVRSEIFSVPATLEDNCCQSSVSHSVYHHSGNFEMTCCHFKVERVKITNYTSFEQLSISAPLDLLPVNTIHEDYSIKGEPVRPVAISNKHGARYIITYYCQFLA